MSSTSRHDRSNKPATPSRQSNHHPGYPYTAPSPNPYPSPDPYLAPDNANRRLILRRLLLAAFVIFAAFIFAMFAVWALTRPDLPEFRIVSVSLSEFNSSSARFSSEFYLTLFVRNPNRRLRIDYGKLDGMVYYQNGLLTETGIAPFEQDTKNERTVEARLAASGTYMGRKLAERIGEERRNGRVVFRMELMGWVNFRPWSWKRKYHLIKVFCGDIPIGFSQNLSESGTFMGGEKGCHVSM